MKLAAINYNDYNNSISGVNISVWVQGCPHKCEGCHNPETWSFFDNGFMEIESEFDTEEFYKNHIDKHINENGIKRDISILGGEPLVKENEKFTFNLISYIKKKYPDRKIYLWTGYSLKELIEKYRSEPDLIKLLLEVDYLITDRFELNKRDPNLKLRGSSNQHIYTNRKKLFSNDKKLIDITEEIDNMRDF